MSRLDLLRISPLFRDVPPQAIAEAEKVVVSRTFRAGEVILEQDEAGDALYLVCSGVVRISRVSLGNRERVMGDVYAPGVIGETAVLGSGERSATVTALTDTSILLLYRDHFRTILRRHPEVLWNLASLLTSRITHLNDELIAFGLNTESALAHVFHGLYEQRRDAGLENPQVLPLTTPDIMQRISASRETVARVIRKMERDGLLQSNGSSITILNPRALEQLGTEDTDDE